ncbi:eukaryotic translation initiation factor 3 subunit K-like [Pyrus ussuriensis x Pyrus communis]|uniref:Eukaryotic translation initiation factor 3 subunit K-like n=1 Tax=Pyrus ussuriensis x Pyrus communis TaxID=2448454 RepID=A0A5N5F8I6_9ROSA|nr:eukaryotic translation initiation factor 3 subunit K-like [Pyrus ussuriensis x Pyrus communis]
MSILSDRIGVKYLGGNFPASFARGIGQSDVSGHRVVRWRLVLQQQVTSQWSSYSTRILRTLTSFPISTTTSTSMFLHKSILGFNVNLYLLCLYQECKSVKPLNLRFGKRSLRDEIGIARKLTTRLINTMQNALLKIMRVHHNRDGPINGINTDFRITFKFQPPSKGNPEPTQLEDLLRALDLQLPEYK